MRENRNQTIWIVGGILSLIIFPLFYNTIPGIIKLDISTRYEFYSALCFLIAFVIVFSVITYSFVKKRKNLLEYNANSKDNKCPYHKGFCCGNDLIDNLKDSFDLSKINLTDDEKRTYNLLNENEFNMIEKEYFTKHSNGQIWVVSFALETEIEFPPIDDDTPLQKSMQIVKQNIENGHKYIQFVALGKDGNPHFKSRKNIYWNGINNAKEKAPIIQIDNNNIGDNMMYMVKLTSAVLFVDKEGKKDDSGEEEEYFVSGYFCFRHDEDKNASEFEKRPVFFRMPRCMENRYFEFLRDKKIEYFNN